MKPADLTNIKNLAEAKKELSIIQQEAKKV